MADICFSPSEQDKQGQTDFRYIFLEMEFRVITTKCGLANGLGEREGDCRSGGIWLRSDCQYSENRKPSELPA